MTSDQPKPATDERIRRVVAAYPNELSLFERSLIARIEADAKVITAWKEEEVLRQEAETAHMARIAALEEFIRQQLKDILTQEGFGARNKRELDFDDRDISEYREVLGDE